MDVNGYECRVHLGSRACTWSNHPAPFHCGPYEEFSTGYSSRCSRIRLLLGTLDDHPIYITRSCWCFELAKLISRIQVHKMFGLSGSEACSFGFWPIARMISDSGRRLYCIIDCIHIMYIYIHIPMCVYIYRYIHIVPALGFMSQHNIIHIHIYIYIYIHT